MFTGANGYRWKVLPYMNKFLFNIGTVRYVVTVELIFVYTNFRRVRQDIRGTCFRLYAAHNALLSKMATQQNRNAFIRE